MTTEPEALSADALQEALECVARASDGPRARMDALATIKARIGCQAHDLAVAQARLTASARENTTLKLEADQMREALEPAARQLERAANAIRPYSEKRADEIKATADAVRAALSNSEIEKEKR